MSIYIYLVIAVWISLLGIWIQLGRTYGWGSTLVIGKKEITLSLNVIPWFLAAATLILFGGLRYHVGTDYESYEEIFNNLVRNWGDARYTGTETGFVWLCRLITVFTDNSQWLFFVTNLIISLLGLACVGRYCRFVPLGLYIFYTTIYYQSFNVIRQGIACAIVFMAFGLYHEGKWVRAVILVLIASLFHRTALIMLPVFFLMWFRYNPVWYILFGIVAVLGGLMQTQISELLLRFYPSAMETSSSYLYGDISPVQVSLCLIYVVLCVIYYKKMTAKNPRNVVCLNFSVLLLGLYACFYWIPMWGRLQLYFICLYAIIVPEVISQEENRLLRVLYYALIWGIMLCFYMVPVLMSGDGFWVYTMIS